MLSINAVPFWGEGEEAASQKVRSGGGGPLILYVKSDVIFLRSLLRGVGQNLTKSDGGRRWSANLVNQN